MLQAASIPAHFLQSKTQDDTLHKIGSNQP